MHLIIGTAGHVDHGKTKIIEALTGEDTDRLKEEKERGISVDLGFAPFKLPSQRVAGVVDVPGHEKFIHNMLAGIAGIDLVLLVVDINEGIMPQTKEHLAIMELLQIKSGVVVLTKIDLADEEWIMLMEEEVMENLHGTFLEDAPVVKTSVVTGEGIDTLKEVIDEQLKDLPLKDEQGPVRMPIDRAFQVPGFGTIVTGTLESGTINKDDELEIVPGNVKTRARQLQVHGEQVEAGKAGQRLAINVPNVIADDLERGYILAEPHYFRAVKQCDVRLNLLEDADWELKNGSPLHIHVGAGESVARVYFYGQKKLSPGGTALAQIRLYKPLPIFRGDRFIVRSYSPVTTIGGGVVLEHNAKKKPLQSSEVIQKLTALEKGEPRELVYQLVYEQGIVPYDLIKKEAGIAAEELPNILSSLEKDELVQRLGDYVVSVHKLKTLEEKLCAVLGNYHKEYPLRPGKPKAELVSLIMKEGIDEKASVLLVNDFVRRGAFELKDDFIRNPGFFPQPQAEQRKDLDRIQELFSKQGFKPPQIEELAQELSVKEDRVKEYLEYLVYQQTLVRVSPEMYLLTEHLEEAKELLMDHFSQQDTLSISEWRDMLNTSRRYALPILEYFDRVKITKRQGDVRVVL